MYLLISEWQYKIYWNKKKNKILEISLCIEEYTHTHKHAHIPVYMVIHQVEALWLFGWESIFWLRMMWWKEIMYPRKNSGLYEHSVTS